MDPLDIRLVDTYIKNIQEADDKINNASNIFIPSNRLNALNEITETLKTSVSKIREIELHFAGKLYDHTESIIAAKEKELEYLTGSDFLGKIYRATTFKSDATINKLQDEISNLHKKVAALKNYNSIAQEAINKANNCISKLNSCPQEYPPQKNQSYSNLPNFNPVNNFQPQKTNSFPQGYPPSKSTSSYSQNNFEPKASSFPQMPYPSQNQPFSNSTSSYSQNNFQPKANPFPQMPYPQNQPFSNSTSSYSQNNFQPKANPFPQMPYPQNQSYPNFTSSYSQNNFEPHYYVPQSQMPSGTHHHHQPFPDIRAKQDYQAQNSPFGAHAQVQQVPSNKFSNVQEETAAAMEWRLNNINNVQELKNFIKNHPEYALTWLLHTQQTQLESFKKFLNSGMFVSKDEQIERLIKIQNEEMEAAEEMVNFVLYVHVLPKDPEISIPESAATLNELYNNYKKSNNDFISLFDLSNNYTEADVNNKFKKSFALKLHPDRNKDYSVEADALFKLFEAIKTYLINDLKFI